MSMPKWLLPQMTKMERTCSKKEGVKPSFFHYTPLKNISQIENIVSS